jgi:hypothetical protein
VIRPIQLMIVGAQKAGTTSLFRYLAQHPAICAHPQRELSFFVDDAVYQRGYGDIFGRAFGDCPDESMLLAKHVMLMYSQAAVERLHEHNSEIHVVAVLRNPVERAYSAYWYARRRGWEHLPTFEEALAAEPLRLVEGWFRWRNCAYLHNSTYDQPIERLRTRFGMDQVHVFATEDLRSDPENVCQCIFGLLGIDVSFVPQVDTQHNPSAMARSEPIARALARFLAPHNPIRRAIRPLLPNSWAYRLRYRALHLLDKSFTQPPMETEIRQRLVEQFRPHNARLAELLGRDLGHWNQ